MKRLRETAMLTATACLLAASTGSAETLQDAWSQALASNPQLAASQFGESAARSDLDAARAARMPSAWARSSYTVRTDERSFRIENPLAPGQVVASPFAQREAAGAAAGVAVPLYTGGRVQNTILAADARLAAAQHASIGSRLELLLAVSEAGLAILRAQRDLSVADQNLVSLNAYATDVLRKFEQQRAPRSDLLAAQVAAASAQQTQMRETHRLATARGEYNRLLSRPLDAPVQLQEIAFQPLRQTLEELQQLAWAKRPELAELRASAEARTFEAERLRAENRPQISALGNYDFEENRFQTPQAITSAGVVLEWKFYNGGQNRRAADAELARASSLAKLGEDLKSRIALELLTAWNSQQEAAARQLVAARAQEQAEENLRVIQLRYGRGMAIGSEVLDAEASRAYAASDFFNAGYDQTLAQIRLRYSAGILGDAE